MVVYSAIRLENEIGKSTFHSWMELWDQLSPPWDDVFLADIWAEMYRVSQYSEFRFAFTPTHLEELLYRVKRDHSGVWWHDIVETVTNTDFAVFMIFPGEHMALGEQQIIYKREARSKGDRCNYLPHSIRTE